MTVLTVRLRSMPSPPSRTVAVLANASAAYPLVYLACLYGEWFLGWAMLGHPPRVSIDDPKFIDGSSWMHYVTLIAMLLVLPMGGLALVCNVWYAVDRRLGPMRIVLRICLVMGLIGGVIALLRLDPWRVGEWWID